MMTARLPAKEIPTPTAAGQTITPPLQSPKEASSLKKVFSVLKSAVFKIMGGVPAGPHPTSDSKRPPTAESWPQNRIEQEEEPANPSATAKDSV